MNRLQSEIRRLYLPRAAEDTDAEAASVIDARGATRALVLEVARQAGWEAVDRTWRGVQAELELPAPAVAVNGCDGFQLWFSLEEPVGTPDAQAFLDGLRRRFLADVAADRVRMMPSQAVAAGVVHARPVPAEQTPPDRWSAFVAPDLAALFVDTPWLDFAPRSDGQADLLRSLKSIGREAFEVVSARLGQAAHRAHPLGTGSASGATGSASAAAARPTMPSDPEAFLRQVMQDDSVPLALRIEAARALLAHVGDRRAR